MTNRSTLDRPINVLFLCTGNSARSILGEAILNATAPERFRGFSAGSMPTGKVHPGALKILAAAGMATEDLASKSWDTFTAGPEIDIAITVCDNAAGEACPVFPGAVVRAHWGIPDPASATDADASFARAFDVLQRRIRRLAALPVGSLAPDSLATNLASIAELEPYRSD